ncbi:MAG: hypothetical protein OSA42_09440 [Porticoccaceae bacterium]|nr:hypothetical protein [Porticoccaceae bacterium]
MNLYLSCGFFIFGTLLLFPFWFAAASRQLLQLDSWRRPSAAVLATAAVVFVYAITRPYWSEYTAGWVVLGLAIVLVGIGLSMFVAEITARRGLIFLVAHYRWFSIPLAVSSWSLGLWLLAWSYIGEVAVVDRCIADRQLKVLCGVRNVEDLVVTPDEQFFIAPEFGGIGPYYAPEERDIGRLMLIDTRSQIALPLSIRYAENTWGDGRCQRTAQMPLSPHGVDLIERRDGAYQLAIINHYPDETVETFELVSEDAGWSLVWRGCVDVPRVNYLNDISLASDGSFYVSHMYSPKFAITDALKAVLFKYATGYVMRWDTLNGFGQVPATAGAHPNGVVYEESKDLLYVAHSYADRVDVVDMLKAAVVSSYSLNSPDNLVLRDDSLWVTSWDHEIAEMTMCEGKRPCALPFSVHKLNPATLQLERRWRFNHAPLGMATVAFPLGDRVWVGSGHADRIGYFEMFSK